MPATSAPCEPRFRPTRRRTLATRAALPFAALAPGTGTSAASGNDAVCTIAGSVSRKLFVPRDTGFLGRLAPHAMHLDGFHFEVLERKTSPDFVATLAIGERARLASDLGRKDTLLVWPGESVRVAIRFTLPWPDAQTYLFHCHNLEHEDGGMMVGVRVA